MAKLGETKYYNQYDFEYKCVKVKHYIFSYIREIYMKENYEVPHNRIELIFHTRLHEVTVSNQNILI